MKPQRTVKNLHHVALPRYDQADYRSIFKLLLTGSLVLVCAVVVLLLISYFILGNTQTLGQLAASSIALLSLFVVRNLAQNGHEQRASVLLVLFYALLAMFTLYRWGLNTPFGIILLSITVVMCSILLGSRATVLFGSVLIGFLLVLQYLISHHDYTPILSESLKPTHMADAIAYSFGIAILVLVSWLYSRQTQKLLHDARNAKAALANEKQMLEIRVKERAAELEKTQLEESRALYQFVEVGQQSAALIHDLANQLTSLTMDLEEIKRSKHSRVIERSQESLRNLEQLVARYRNQLQGNEKFTHFSVVSLVRGVIHSDERIRAAVKLDIAKNARSLRIIGDPLRLNQVLTILLNNALEAIQGKDGVITLEIHRDTTSHSLLLTVKDTGRGIPAVHHKQLFKPVQSSKKEGLGIGLFIARKITETHFKGSLTCTSLANPTVFTIRIPIRS